MHIVGDGTDADLAAADAAGSVDDDGAAVATGGEDIFDGAVNNCDSSVEAAAVAVVNIVVATIVVAVGGVATDPDVVAGTAAAGVVGVSVV